MDLWIFGPNSFTSLGTKEIVDGVDVLSLSSQNGKHKSPKGSKTDIVAFLCFIAKWRTRGLIEDRKTQRQICFSQWTGGQGDMCFYLVTEWRTRKLNG